MTGVAHPPSGVAGRGRCGPAGSPARGGRCLPHAAAEEAALYPAGDTGLTALLVRAMPEEHKGIVADVERLRGGADGRDAVATASAILALFEAHPWTENELLIPVLVVDPNVSLGELLSGLHELVG